MLQDTEESVEEDLEANGRGVGTVQHQTGDVEHDVGLDNLHIHAQVQQVLVAEFVQS